MNAFSSHTLTAVLPCKAIAATRAFYERLGFRQTAGDDTYSMLDDGRGGKLHLRSATEVMPASNPCGVYLYAENIDELAANFPSEILGKTGHPEIKPWGMYEFALSDPDGALARIGWPDRP